MSENVSEYENADLEALAEAIAIAKGALLVRTLEALDLACGSDESIPFEPDEACPYHAVLFRFNEHETALLKRTFPEERFEGGTLSLALRWCDGKPLVINHVEFARLKAEYVAWLRESGTQEQAEKQAEAAFEIWVEQGQHSGGFEEL